MPLHHLRLLPLAIMGSSVSGKKEGYTQEGFPSYDLLEDREEGV